MAQYCELAKTVTNCTDDCRACLEEEAKTRKIRVGDKVRCIRENTDVNKKLGVYPPKGTIGTVARVEDGFFLYYVRWPKGTTIHDGCWYVGRNEIELVCN